MKRIIPRLVYNSLKDLLWDYQDAIATKAQMKSHLRLLGVELKLLRQKRRARHSGPEQRRLEVAAACDHQLQH